LPPGQGDKPLCHAGKGVELNIPPLAAEVPVQFHLFPQTYIV
jgi:hypothetical protein